MDLTEWLTGFAGAAPIEWLGTVAGIICVALYIRRSIWAWPVGLFQVILYVYIFWQAKLYSDMGLNVIYIFLQIYGWWVWLQHQDQQAELVVELGVGWQYGLWVLTALVGAFVMGWLLTHTDASLPYADSLVASTSLVAQWLLTRRKLFNWSFWIAVDAVAIWVYYQKGLYPTTVLYACFFVMASIGQYSWWKRYHAQTPVKAEPSYA
ncbi:MAG: nicotinamide riboside transporter PnuC [Thiolinea sp.]